MSRYYALVLVPGDTAEDEACNAALDLLYPYMIIGPQTAPTGKFDYVLSPEDIADLSDGEISRNVWRAGEISEKLAELEVEALVTPDGRWHETGAGQLWDDGAWLERARRILRQHEHCLALRHVLHT